MKKIGKVILIIICSILIICTMAGATFFVVRKMGEKNLANRASSELPQMETVKSTSEETTLVETEIEEELKPGEVLYKGQKYAYNSDIVSFVIMGIDSMKTVEELKREETGGQSDLIFLLVADKKNNVVKLIGINRNTMTNIWRCDTNYNYYDTEFAQITLQHAYGTGAEDSCEKMVAAVDEVMYMIPIHGYYALNMGAITLLNDAVGGVELIAIEDVYKSNIRKGDKLTLMGQDAYNYVHNRDYHESGTADDRLVRQKQYMRAFLKKVLEGAKKDISIPLNLYNIVSDYAVTDLTVDEITYLFSEYMGCSIDMDRVYSIPGETVYNEESDHDEFYVDEAALYEMILEIFYEQVK